MRLARVCSVRGLALAGSFLLVSIAFGGAPDTTAPTTPASLTVSPVNCNQVSLSWPASVDPANKQDTISGLKGYNVYRAGILLKFVTGTSTTDTGLSANTTYSYTVAAVDVAGNQSAQSVASSARTPLCPDTLPPSVPGNLAGNALDCSRVSLTWSASSETSSTSQQVSGVKGYNLYRNNSLIAFTTGASATDSGLAGNTAYSYRVSAVDNANNESGLSIATSVTTSICTDSTPPSVPTGLTSTSLNCSGISMTWGQSSDPAIAGQQSSGLKGYNVYRNGFFLQFVTSQNLSDANVVPNSSYVYRVSAVDNGNNESVPSAPLNITIPGCPGEAASNLAIFVSNGQARLQWTGTPGARYLLERALTLTSPWGPVDAPTLNFAVTNFASDWSCVYRVGLFTNTPGYLQNYLTNSMDVSPPATPAALNAVALSSSTVSLSWSPVTDVATVNGSGVFLSGLDRYLLYRDGIFLKAAPANITSTSDTAAAPGRSYIYSVAAVDKAGNVSGTASAGANTCIFFSPPGSSVGPDATSGWFAVDATGCSWSASVSVADSWIQLQGPTSGTGSANINYSVLANQGGSDRTGAILVQNKSYLITQQGRVCGYLLSPDNFSYSSGAANGSFTVNVSSGCNWSATANSAWIHTSTSGNGTGTVSYTVDANNSTIARSGAISVGGQTFAVNQAAAPCVYLLTPSISSPGAAAFSGSFSVTAPSGCSWWATPSVGWIHSLTSGNGSGAVDYTVDANPGTSPRSGIIDIAGQSFTITQSGQGCSYSLSPTSLTVGPGATNGTLAMTASPGCIWSASTTDGWLHSTTSGVGIGNATYAVDANTTIASRTGTIIVGGQSFSITQTGVGCTYSLSPTNVTLAANGTVGTIAVTTLPGCSWAASSTDAWIHSTTPGVGSGTATYGVDANPGTTVRVGSINIGGRVFTITQNGTSCSYTLGSSGASFSSAANSSSVTVTAGSGCSWVATSGAAWLVITSGSSGTGSGSVSYNVTANPSTSSRTASLTIAGQNYSVTQNGNQLPVANAGPDLNITVGNTANFSASSSYDPDGTINSYAWNFGDGYTASGASVSHAYSILGVYTVTLTVTDNLGAIDTDTALATIVALPDITPPSVTMTAPSSGSTVSNVITLSASASDNAGGSGVARVEFYCDSLITPLAVASNAPYSGSCDTKTISNGSHSFYSKAIDNAGNANNSASVTVTINNQAQPTNYWAKRFGSTGNDSGTAVATDAAGNLYVAGYFEGVVDFGGGPLASAGGSDIFLAKYTAAGAHVWSKRFGGVADESVRAIALDSAGNIYVGGYFMGTANFGGTNLSSTPTNVGDAFLAKYSPQGAHIWSLGFGGPYSDQINSIAIDSQTNVVVTGFFQGTVVIAGTTLIDNGQADTFLAKFTSTGAGLWARNFPPNGGFDQGNAVAVDRNDNIYLTGTLANYINLGGEAFSTPGGYLGKFNSAGAHIWSRLIGTNTAARIGGMSVDSNGDVAICGSFYHQTDLGGGPVFGTSSGFDIFVAKYVGSSGAYRWAWTSTGGMDSGANAVATDAQNNIILTGVYRGTYIIAGQTLSNYSTTYDGFMAKFNSSGTALTAQGFGGADSDGGNAIATDASGSCVVVGAFSSTATCAGQTLTSAGLTDIVLMKVP